MKDADNTKFDRGKAKREREREKESVSRERPWEAAAAPAGVPEGRSVSV